MATSRTLNVSDALNYLDLVSTELGDHSHAYNEFLHVMKDFKSQAIDVPGVIVRIVNLFQGHPTLFEGFNTFLPDEYRINYASDQPSGVTVSSPSGTWIPTLVAVPGAQVAQTNGVVDPATTATTTGDNQPTPFAATPTIHTDPNFTTALNFLGKVKTRYANQPEKYKQFLVLLSSPDALHNVDTPNHIAALFEDSPDLKEAFSAFLPAVDRNLRLILSKL